MGFAYKDAEIEFFFCLIAPDLVICCAWKVTRGTEAPPYVLENEDLSTPALYELARACESTTVWFKVCRAVWLLLLAVVFFKIFFFCPDWLPEL